MASNIDSNSQGVIAGSATSSKKGKKPTARKSVVGFGGPYRTQATGGRGANSAITTDAQRSISDFRRNASNGGSGAPPPLGLAVPVRPDLRQSRRYRKVLRDKIQGITAPDIRRLARRGGVKRIQKNVYEETRLAMKLRLEALLRDVITIVVYAGRKTVTTLDVVYALKKQGNTIYGFGEAILPGA
ncbi:hypothetical protein M409DRAFT_55332 [Zasmidium cellare ATCC 36951]|uniref:Histone H4 n=1 Tax=Zasmidium cellare ATCC 36951 TaxID=1080233 RepID=A0A6A6CH47_ZASCE|nr:uncharacterized protein M409DRAFT_55332 [Zasmidium cellare ATCC 36951]KAF2165973.1 hypothetical protein M409DRAFT_55332 [Zasmidium cellare ATCC 36951]